MPRGPQIVWDGERVAASLAAFARDLRVAALAYSARPRSGVADAGPGTVPAPLSRLSSAVSIRALTQSSGFQSTPPVANRSERKGDGSAFYMYCRQQGIWPREISA